MTTPNFAKPVDGVDVKPQFEGEIAKTAVAAFSNSAKIPISRMDAAAGLAANEVIGLLQKQPRADLRQLIARVRLAAAGHGFRGVGVRGSRAAAGDPA